MCSARPATSPVRASSAAARPPHHRTPQPTGLTTAGWTGSSGPRGHQPVQVLGPTIAAGIDEHLHDVRAPDRRPTRHVRRRGRPHHEGRKRGRQVRTVAVLASGVRRRASRAGIQVATGRPPSPPDRPFVRDRFSWGSTPRARRPGDPGQPTGTFEVIAVTLPNTSRQRCHLLRRRLDGRRSPGRCRR